MSDGKSSTSNPSRESVNDAMARALRHARAALAEGLLAAQALLDAASIGIYGEPARTEAIANPELPDARRALALMSRALEQLSRAAREQEEPLGQAGEVRDALASAILAALDDEILRWEMRSSQDPDARAVLRAFIGLREILWELGIRTAAATSTRPDAAAPTAGEEGAREAARVKTEPKAPRPRVQRVEVKG